MSVGGWGDGQVPLGGLIGRNPTDRDKPGAKRRVPVDGQGGP